MQIDSTLSMPATGYLPSATPKISGAAPVQLPARGITESTGTLQEPIVSVGGGTAVLRDGGGGNASVQMAAALYTLNVSFDMQKVALDLLA